MTQTNPNQPRPGQSPSKPGQNQKNQERRTPDRDHPERVPEFNKPGDPNQKTREATNPPYRTEDEKRREAQQRERENDAHRIGNPKL